MNYDFFADKSDKLQILEYIFSDTDLKVYDSYSAYGQELFEYKSANEIATKFDLDNGNQFAVCFQLWSPRHKGNVLIRKISLDPKSCNGHTFRYSTTGWGLIQLYFGGKLNNLLNPSHIGHFNEKGALGRMTYNNINGNAADWDWNELLITSRKLKYHIHNKLATKKIGSMGVLAGAERLANSGVEFR